MTVNAAWLMNLIYDHYRFTGDEDYLRQRAYPMMKGASMNEESRRETTDCRGRSEVIRSLGCFHSEIDPFRISQCGFINERLNDGACSGLG